jgi:hypothetical protein
MIVKKKMMWYYLVVMECECECVDCVVEKPDILAVETYPVCEHRIRVPLSDGEEGCWICGATLTAEEVLRLTQTKQPQDLHP